MAQPLVFNLQRYAIHDGAGIRETVFFKGCPLRCAWCHNPEGISFEPEWMRYPDRCIGCGRCETGSPSDCPTGARTLVGEAYSVEELTAKLLRDRVFYEASGGGVTLSGGEVMAQDSAYITALCKALHRQGIRVAIDTSGHVPYERFQAILPYVDTFLYDIKTMDSAVHERFTGVKNERILENLVRLSRDGARINVRVPVIPEVNGSDEAMQAILSFVRDNVQTVQVNLLSYHRLGQDKHEHLGAASSEAFTEPSPARMEALAQMWRDAGFTNTKIGG